MNFWLFFKLLFNHSHCTETRKVFDLNTSLHLVKSVKHLVDNYRNAQLLYIRICRNGYMETVNFADYTSYNCTLTSAC